MKPTAAVTELVIRGRTIIPVGKLGKFWQAEKRPQSFTGQTVYELMLVTPGQDWKPFKPEWIIDYEPPCTPILYRAQEQP